MEFFTRKKLKAAGKMAVRQAVDKALESNYMIVHMYNHMNRFYANRHTKEESVEVLDSVKDSIHKLALQTIDAIEVSPTKNLRVANKDFVMVYTAYPTLCGAHVVIEYCGHISYGNKRYDDLYAKEA